MKEALIIFAKRPVPGAVKTRLTPPLTPQEAARLYECMLRDILTRTAYRGGDRYLFYEDEPAAASYFAGAAGGMTCQPQAGSNLGKRMEGAFRHLFARGYRSVAIIGTDSPDLPLQYLEMAYELLGSREESVVIGPSADGGYYLLGMNRLHPQLFSGVPWSSGEVLQKSLEKAAAAGIGVELLPLWYDIDTVADLVRMELLEDDSDAHRTRDCVRGLARYFKTSTS